MEHRRGQNNNDGASPWFGIPAPASAAGTRGPAGRHPGRRLVRHLRRDDPPSPHAAELLDAKHRLSADLVTDASRRYQCLVRDVLAEAAATGELDLDAAGLTADTAAELMIASARGLESIAASPAAYRRHLDTLVRVMIAGLTPRGNRS